MKDLEIDYRKLIHLVHSRQMENMCSAEDFRSKKKGKGTSILGTESRGLYWLWCDLDNANLDSLDDNVDLKIKTAHVPISKLIKSRKDFKHVCKIKQDGIYSSL